LQLIGIGLIEEDSVGVVSRDQVAGSGGRAANQVA
jgi:hypothetical protein